nr:hypothetical protein [Tanacetum cinerariifolium]
MLPIELINEDIRNSKAYKEYYAVALGAAPLKTKASVRKTKSSSNTFITPPTAVGSRLSTSRKGKQPAKSSKAKSLTMLSKVAITEAEQIKLAIKRSLQQTHICQASGLGADKGTGIIPGVPDVPTEEFDEEISWKSSDEDDDDDVDEGSDDQDDDDDDQDTDEEGEEFIHPKLSIHDAEETKDEESFDPIAKTPDYSNDAGNNDENIGLNVGSEEGQDAEDDEDELYRDVNIILEGRVVQMTDVHTTQEFKDTHVTLTLVNPDGIDSLLETTSQMDVPASTAVVSLTLTTPTLTPSTIATISTVPQAPTPPTTALSTLLQDLLNFGSLFRFNHRLKTLEANFSEVFKNLDDNIQKIIKKQVKEQVNVQVFKILPKIEKTVNKQLEAKVLTRSSNSSKTSYAVTADLSKMELKKILIEKMEGNKSDRGSKRRREGKEPESTRDPKEKATKTTGKSTQGFKSQQKTASESAPADEPMQTTHDLVDPSHQEFETAFQMNRLKVDTLTLELLAGPTYELMKGSCKSLVELEFFLKEVYKATTDQLWAHQVDRRLGASYNVESRTGSLHEMSTLNVESSHVEDLQLGFESYQKKLNLTKPDTYRSDLKHKEAYTAYSNPRGFIYQNKDKQNRLIRIGELHKFSDGTLNDVRTALDDRLKVIRIKYLPQTIWRKSDKERAVAMIQAIDKQLKTRRIMRSL